MNVNPHPIRQQNHIHRATAKVLSSHHSCSPRTQMTAGAQILRFCKSSTLTTQLLLTPLTPTTASIRKSNYLDLNPSNTKEMLVDFRRDQPTAPTLEVKIVECVEKFKYLGTTRRQSPRSEM